MKRILVTGGNGFIGSHLAESLKQEGNFVRVVDINPNVYMKKKHYSEDLRLDLRRWKNCLTVTEDVDEVFNLAANMGGIGFISQVGAEVMHDNCLINSNMLEASRHNKVKRFFLSSSACVYPTYRQTNAKASGLKEDDALPADPDNFYGWEKLFAEKMCEAYHRDYGMKIRIARYHNIYGPRGTFSGGREKSIAALCRKVAEASDPGEIMIWGDGEQTRSFCHIEDCVRGTILLMKSDFEGPVNIGSEELVTIDRLAELIINISGKNITTKHDLTAPQGVRGRNADANLAKKVLGWQPRVRLLDGLAETYRWIEKQLYH